MKVQHVFGAPGDFHLTLLEQIENTEKIKFISHYNELNAAYASDGYARTSGIAALLTTFDIDDFGAISSIADAYAENAPLLWITGAAPLHARPHRDIIIIVLQMVTTITSDVVWQSFRSLKLISHQQTPLTK